MPSPTLTPRGNTSFRRKIRKAGRPISPPSSGSRPTSSRRNTAATPIMRCPPNVKAVIGFYGAYDMLAQWQHDQIARPHDQITEKYLGVSPMQNRRAYFDSSPMSYATTDRNRARF